MTQDLGQIIKQYSNTLFKYLVENNDLSLELLSLFNDPVKKFTFNDFIKLIEDLNHKIPYIEINNIFDKLIEVKNNSKLYKLTLEYYDSFSENSISVYFSDIDVALKAKNHIQVNIDELYEFDDEFSSKKHLNFFGNEVIIDKNKFIELIMETKQHEFFIDFDKYILFNKK